MISPSGPSRNQKSPGPFKERCINEKTTWRGVAGVKEQTRAGRQPNTRDRGKSFPSPGCKPRKEPGGPTFPSPGLQTKWGAGRVQLGSSYCPGMGAQSLLQTESWARREQDGHPTSLSHPPHLLSPARVRERQWARRQPGERGRAHKGREWIRRLRAKGERPAQGMRTYGGLTLGELNQGTHQWITR